MSSELVEYDDHLMNGKSKMRHLLVDGRKRKNEHLMTTEGVYIKEPYRLLPLVALSHIGYMT